MSIMTGTVPLGKNNTIQTMKFTLIWLKNVTAPGHWMYSIAEMKNLQ
jgi:hypothetical protein